MVYFLYQESCFESRALGGFVPRNLGNNMLDHHLYCVDDSILSVAGSLFGNDRLEMKETLRRGRQSASILTALASEDIVAEQVLGPKDTHV